MATKVLYSIGYEILKVSKTCLVSDKCLRGIFPLSRVLGLAPEPETFSKKVSGAGANSTTQDMYRNMLYPKNVYFFLFARRSLAAARS